MQFNAPIGIQNKPYFAEGSKLSSARDNRNVSLLWKKVNQDTRQQTDVVEALSKMERQIAKMRRMIKGGYMPQDISVITPFQIYNITNTTNGSDSWGTYQIRDGFVTARSKYWLNGYNYLGTPNPTPAGGLPTSAAIFDRIWANNENLLPVIQDAQGINQEGPNQQPQPNTGTTIKLALTTDTLICGYDSSGTRVYNAQIAMADGIVGVPHGSPSIPMASFWIEIQDDATKGFCANLWGRMCGGATGNTPTQQHDPFPIGKNIIPIGIVLAETTAQTDTSTFNTVLTPTGTSYYYQILNGSNQLPTGLGPTIAPPYATGANNLLNFRGAWSNGGDSGASLSGQVFYPGDLVLDDSADYYMLGNIYDSDGVVIGYSNTFGVFLYVGDTAHEPGNGPGFETVAPHSDTSVAPKWKYICSRELSETFIPV